MGACRRIGKSRPGSRSLPELKRPADSVATLFDLQEKNRRKTRLIVLCFVVFFIWLGLGLDLSLYYLKGSSKNAGNLSRQNISATQNSTPDNAELRAPAKQRKPFYPVYAAVVGLAGAIAAWWSMSNASETVLKTMMAKPADKTGGADEQTLVNVVEEMCIAAGLAPPSVWIIPDDDPNALATGLEDGDYHIAVTRGLLAVLTRDELQAVVAHEIAHLKNGDTRLMTSLAVLVGMTALISEFVARVRFSNSRAGSVSDNIDVDTDDIRIGALIFVLWLVSILVAPTATRLMALMVSREREYLADASSAQFTRNPEALASALAKIAQAAGPTQLVAPASAMLCIASPASADLSWRENWFATHPPIRKRIGRLKSMGAPDGFQNTVRMHF